MFGKRKTAAETVKRWDGKRIKRSAPQISTESNKEAIKHLASTITKVQDGLNYQNTVGMIKKIDCNTNIH